MSEPFTQRTRACQRRLESSGDDVAVLFPSPNCTYVTGFDVTPSERHLVVFVPREGSPTIVAPAMYAEQLTEVWIDDVRHWDDRDDPVELIDEVLLDLGVEGIGGDDSEKTRGIGEHDDSGESETVEECDATDSDEGKGGYTRRILVDDTMWATFTQELRELRPSAVFGLASTVFEPLRVRKDEVELESLRRAGALADEVSLELRERGQDVIGMTETDLASEIDRLLAAHGGIEPAFETIVATGPNGARPHHHCGDREIAPGEPVVLDFGAFVSAEIESGTSHYPGDQTRTIVFDGEPSATYQHVHAVVQEAQEAAVGAVEPGVTASEIDRTARAVIEDAGYGEAFVHRTGHGVGLEVHEPPYIVDGNDRELEAGMVFSVEPGVYLEGEFGVRIEDLVVVTDDGHERLNDSPRGWRATHV